MSAAVASADSKFNPSKTPIAPATVTAASTATSAAAAKASGDAKPIAVSSDAAVDAVAEVERARDSAVRELQALYSEFGAANYIGESISQIEHALQAAECAWRGGFDEEVVIAALLHDVGHLHGHVAKLPTMTAASGDLALGVAEHERVGAAYLKRLGVCQRICHLVGSHVAAKRYLCWRQPSYAAKLSAASRATLQCQGGAMSDAEAAAFEADPDQRVICLMRTWDETAKRVAWKGPGFDAYTAALRKHIHSHPQCHEQCAKFAAAHALAQAEADTATVPAPIASASTHVSAAAPCATAVAPAIPVLAK